MAQAAHGSAPDIAGQDRANPIGLLGSTTLLFRWLAERHADAALAAVGEAIDAALLRTVAEGTRTRDLSGSAGTREFAAAVVATLGEQTGESTGATR